MALRTSLHTTVAALILVSSHAISTALEATGTNGDDDFRPRADVPNAQLEVQEQLKVLGIPVNGVQIDLKTTSRPILGSSPDKRLFKRTIGISPLESIQFETYYGIDVQVDGKTFRMWIDTGSADFWVPAQNVKCVDKNLMEIPQSRCNFTQFTPPTYSGGQIPDRNFNITYGDGELYVGTAGYEPVTVGGLTVKRQTVAKVELAYRISAAHNWNGIIGLGFPNTTNVFPGSDPTKDNITYPNPHNAIPYNPWMLSAFEDGLIEKPVFTLLLGPQGRSDGEIAGSMIIGGAAPPNSVQYGGVTASTKLRIFQPPIRNYWWNFVPDGMKIGDQFIPWDEPASFDDGMWPYLVDCGAGYSYLPLSTMDPWLKTFDPPSISTNNGSYAPCNATFSSVAVRIGGKDIPFANSSLLLPPPYGAVDGMPGYCWTGIQSWGYVLGGSFLSGVAATFDMTSGSEKMVFSSIVR
ncbi:aspartic peptidase domain-containing protein [Bipolaris maydis]|nr:aspartic peptidase domain-containing protein [Bipolaris maydis]KAJ5056095.1 aspartic peptidase domain-containing protein [Bipolaris maydis]KAJ6193844.1 aspartic peptidase domain-containing protein [Bipolaris maydis]KAJ6212027.1 aspartic peptidase domain-containing protein [Bipolaris maydis]KAJ6267056.1 aspartic peptidase domain-containing protein [Bipolaris maydis]